MESCYLTKKDCPNCKVAKSLLDKAKVKYTTIDAEKEIELSKEFNVKQAPTLIVIHVQKLKNILMFQILKSIWEVNNV